MHSASETCDGFCCADVLMQHTVVMESQHLRYSSFGTNWNKNIQTAYSFSTAGFVHCCVVEKDGKYGRSQL